MSESLYVSMLESNQFVFIKQHIKSCLMIKCRLFNNSSIIYLEDNKK